MKKKLISIPLRLSNQVQAYADKHHEGYWVQACKAILEERMKQERNKQIFNEWSEGLE